MKLDKIAQAYSHIAVNRTTDAAISPAGGDEKMFVADGAKLLDKMSALHELYTALGFTEYLPYANYDGFEELMSPDLWSSDTLTLRIMHADALERLDEQVARMLLTILESSIETWRVAGKSLTVELVS